VQPNSGLVVYGQLERHFGDEQILLHTKSGPSVLQFSKPTALRAGLFGYVSPLRRWNQSLRVGVKALTQTAPNFDNQSLVSDGFSGLVFPYANHLMSFSGRYTIPLFYPDNGGLLIPLHVSSIYLSGFSDTVLKPSNGASRTVIGAGIRVQFRLSNLSFDIGAGLGFEPSRDKIHAFVGNF